ncbi:MAG TPA: type IV toxin-antitoxin system AbiEi family antitoxin [Polyangiales bacterium]|nr:type IV toxin-antitoxin system AbiEi family antitoxin [Polyangiales bacterium]
MDSAESEQVFAYAAVRSHLTAGSAELWIGRAQSAPAAMPLVLLCTYVSEPMGARLRAAGVNYVDVAGNLSIVIKGRTGPQYVALIDGRAAPKAAAADRTWRAASYQVLFTLLAEPQLLTSPVRTIAARAEVSTSPVLQVRDTLLAKGWVVKSAKSMRWAPDASLEARDFWLRGYQSTLRPSLMLQRFRARDELDAAGVEEEIEKRLGRDLGFRYGGAAASFRLDAYYRGDTTVVYVDGNATSAQALTAKLRMVPDPKGSVIFLRRPGQAAFELGAAQVTLPATGTTAIVHTVQPPVVHPLLIWAELLEEGHGRASEAAEEIASQYLSGGPGAER